MRDLKCDDTLLMTCVIVAEIILASFVTSSSSSNIHPSEIPLAFEGSEGVEHSTTTASGFIQARNFSIEDSQAGEDAVGSSEKATNASFRSILKGSLGNKASTTRRGEQPNFVSTSPEKNRSRESPEMNVALAKYSPPEVDLVRNSNGHSGKVQDGRVGNSRQVGNRVDDDTGLVEGNKKREYPGLPTTTQDKEKYPGLLNRVQEQDQQKAVNVSLYHAYGNNKSLSGFGFPEGPGQNQSSSQLTLTGRDSEAKTRGPLIFRDGSTAAQENQLQQHGQREEPDGVAEQNGSCPVRWTFHEGKCYKWVDGKPESERSVPWRFGEPLLTRDSVVVVVRDAPVNSSSSSSRMNSPQRAKNQRTGHRAKRACAAMGPEFSDTSALSVASAKCESLKGFVCQVRAGLWRPGFIDQRLEDRCEKQGKPGWHFYSGTCYGFFGLGRHQMSENVVDVGRVKTDVVGELNDDEQLPWDLAQAKCRDFGSELVVIMDENTNEFLLHRGQAVQKATDIIEELRRTKGEKSHQAVVNAILVFKRIGNTGTTRQRRRWQFENACATRRPSFGNPRRLESMQIFYSIPEQLPWQISVQFYGVVHFCGGTILRKNIALTAGHCIEGFQAWELAAVAGITDRSSSASSMQVRRVERMEAHPKYNPVNALNDLGIILLETDFDFNSFVQHIPLPKETTIVKPDSDCIVSGWGSTDPYGIEDASRLQYAKLKIVPDSRCQERLTVFRRVYGQSFSKDLHLCAAVESGLANACFGDSGGPFVCPTRRNATFLAGVVSWGPEVCGSSVIPVVFTDVRAYLPWIVRTVADLHQAQQRMMNST
ncbi:unnamed protein product [Notodromas monacha]|uniref:Peptidase S1 domain-containing protein n=1 Tax=Notodromas monacha TaxID=399045 RepID=A0A7R9BWI6_9CRUS|nr:unnamed protein product [Notodromas monacha]CAG0921538.1 unnamed protein product [Notodromas monacha]